MNAKIIEKIIKEENNSKYKSKYKNLLLAQKLIDIELPRIINNACSLLESLNMIKVISLLYKMENISIPKNHIFNKTDLIDNTIKALFNIIKLKEIDSLIFRLNSNFVEKKDFDIAEFRKILLRIKTSFPNSIILLKDYDYSAFNKECKNELIKIEVENNLLEFTSFYDEVIPVIDFFYKTL